MGVGEMGVGKMGVGEVVPNLSIYLASYLPTYISVYLSIYLSTISIYIHILVTLFGQVQFHFYSIFTVLSTWLLIARKVKLGVSLIPKCYFSDCCV